MDLKEPINKQNLIKAYKNLWSKFNNYTQTLINDPLTYKRAALLYYWLNQYFGYVKGEPTFNPKYRPALLRGNIIKVNFGFNLGNEFGGLHYAVVMNNSSAQNGVVTVIPLRSLKTTEDPENLRGNDVFLSDELYNLLRGKLNGLHSALSNQLQELLSCKEKSTSQLKIKEIKEKLTLISKTQNEISSLKLGSVAITNQITTISKIRIEDPKNNLGILFGLRLSREKMQLIKAELIKQYDL